MAVVCTPWQLRSVLPVQVYAHLGPSVGCSTVYNGCTCATGKEDRGSRCCAKLHSTPPRVPVPMLILIALLQ